ncbi:MAG: dihydrofolate reductase [Acaryochloridaceae cyanobacterium RU_4_10]|nr:dihydrofolate reductase [Acaryochloridaceae cyanobacterium RU_4_10]
MNTPKISAIAAIGSQNRALSKEGKLPWHIPKDQKWFQTKTIGHVVIMGRKTFEQIKRIPLNGRTNIVISSQADLNAEGFISTTTLEEALEKAREIEKDEIFIVGGGQIYTLGLPFTDRLYLTLVEGEFADSDTFFPEYSAFDRVVYEQYNDESNGESGYKYAFYILEKSN